MERKRHRRLEKVSNQYLPGRANDLLTFGVARGSEGEKRAFFNVDYIASDELGDLARLGIVFEMDITCVFCTQFNIPRFRTSFVPSITYATAGPG